MLRFFKSNWKPIVNLFKILLVIFGSCATFFLTIAYFYQNVFPLKYGLIFTLAICIFTTLAFIFLESLRIFNENCLFKKTPYNTIDKLVYKTEYCQDSKYGFFKKHRFIKIEQEHYEIIFYSDIVRNEFGNSLVVIKNFGEKQKPILHQIKYKEQKFSESSLFAELKKI